MAPTRTIQTEHELMWYRNLPVLIDMAFAARERAVSHRKIPFKVGAAALVYSPADRTYGNFDGANYKPHPKGPRKCAEEGIISQAKDAGVEIIGMAIVAPHQPDDHTGIDLGITPCCVFCRKLIHKERKAEKSCITSKAYLMFVNADIPTKRVELSVSKMLHIFSGEF